MAIPAAVVVAVFAAPELDLGEEGLARGAGGPVDAVVEARGPLEVVVGFTWGGGLGGVAGVAGVIADALEEGGERFEGRGKIDFF